MQEFYSSLYASDPIDLQSAQSFLSQTPLSRIKPHQLSALNAPISLTEISDTIRSLAANKVPGLMA